MGEQGSDLTDPRQESSRLPHVVSILVTKAGKQDLLLFFGANQNQDEEQHARKSEEPVGRRKGICEHEQGTRGVKRMPYPAIRATGDQRVFLSRDNGIGEVFPQIVERPEEERSRDDPQAYSDPP